MTARLPDIGKISPENLDHLTLPLALDVNGLNATRTAIQRQYERQGITIIAGHTGRYDGCDDPMAGGAAVMSVSLEDAAIVLAMAVTGQ